MDESRTSWVQDSISGLCRADRTGGRRCGKFERKDGALLTASESDSLRGGQAPDSGWEVSDKGLMQPAILQEGSFEPENFAIIASDL